MELTAKANHGFSYRSLPRQALKVLQSSEKARQTYVFLSSMLAGGHGFHYGSSSGARDRLDARMFTKAKRWGIGKLTASLTPLEIRTCVEA